MVAQEECVTDTIRCIAVDPGLASLGVAVLELRAGLAFALAATVLRTKKADQKLLRDIRVSADDLRRLRSFWRPLHELVRAHKPQALAVETYAPRPGQSGSSGWKAAMVYGLVVGLGLAHGLTVIPLRPDDLKRQFTGRASASKDDVGTAVVGQVSGLAELVAKLPKGQHEHVTDAAGHALLGLHEMVELRRSMGFTDSQEIDTCHEISQT
jgi:Holliday junction resolvasome RuvABC endonuclease subunit